MAEQGQEDAPEVKRWLTDLNYRGYGAKRTGPERIALDATNFNEVDLRGGPPGWTVSLLGLGTSFSYSTVTVVCDQPDATFEIEVGTHVQTIRIQGAVGTIRLSQVEGRTQAGLLLIPSVNNVDIAGGNWSLRGSPLREVRVKDANISGASTERFVFEGSVGVAQIKASTSAAASDSAVLRLGPEVTLGSIKFSESASSKVLKLVPDVGKEATINDMVADGTVELSGGRLVITRQESRTRIQRLKIKGTGEVHVNAPLDGPQFDPSSPGSLLVRVSHPGQLIEASGRLVLEAPTGAECLGDQTSPLVLDDVRNASGAELENVDVHDLTPAHMAALRQTTRLIPRLPKGGVRVRRVEGKRLPRFSKGSLRTYLDSMLVGGGPDELIAAKRSFFWSDLSMMLRDKHTPGAVQSDVRWAAMRSRQKAVKNKRRSREWWLLFVYSGMGYGERIFLPLFSQVALSVVFALTVLHASLNHRLVHLTWWRAILQAIALPLSLFRVLNENQDIILHPTWAVALLRVTGVILVGLSLLAIRRVVKAE